MNQKINDNGKPFDSKNNIELAFCLRKAHLLSYLHEIAKDSGLNFRYFLAHADDGVIWGYVNDNGNLITSHEAFSEVLPALSPVTLQQARLFGGKAELHLWRMESGKFQGRLIEDEGGDKAVEYYDECQILWGNKFVKADKGFTWVAEGQQGLQHAVPISISNEKKYFGTKEKPHHPLRLQVRHYLKADDLGQVRVYASRLVTVCYEAGGN